MEKTFIFTEEQADIILDALATKGYVLLNYADRYKKANNTEAVKDCHAEWRKVREIEKILRAR